MEIKIYQIKDSKNVNYAFRDWECAKEDYCPGDYECVFSFNSMLPEITKAERVLNHIFDIFNASEKPVGFKGHSLSVSDIVAIGHDYYYCDDIGWAKI